MNGRHLLEQESAGQWKTSKVAPSEGLKAGIYNLYLAKPATPKQSASGVVVHADKESLYLMTGKDQFVCFKGGRDAGIRVGQQLSLTLNDDLTVAQTETSVLSRGLRR